LLVVRDRRAMANAGPASKKYALHFFQIIARAICLNALTRFLPETSIPPAYIDKSRQPTRPRVGTPRPPAGHTHCAR
jgi:hypothetical protein